jgi:UDP-N-acetyl-2-amino-2-deoxyglucuronate dehydrogenase
MKRFALIGAAGYIAPRHLEAIHSLGHQLVAAYDPNDSVGILDKYFPECRFFTDLERFDAYLRSEQEKGRKTDYVSICSPNFLHCAHIQYGLRLGANVICEKPLVLSEGELDEVARVQAVLPGKVTTILQLRVHHAIMALREKIASMNVDRFKVSLTYMTSRGPWYNESWKGDVRLSGGLSCNIGIHFFDMLTWIFGDVQNIKLIQRTSTEVAGQLILERADVDWFLTIDRNNLPEKTKREGKGMFRSLKIDGQEFEFSEGFGELHKKVYSDILTGQGWGLDSFRPSIRIIESLNSMGIGTTYVPSSVFKGFQALDH